MRHTTVLGVLLRLHVFIALLLLLGMILYGVGGFQGFLGSTQAGLLQLIQHFSIAGLLSGGYVLIAALVSFARGRRRVWKLVLGVFLSSLFCGAVSVASLFLQAMIV
ncbi:MAG: hypothetical protein ACLFNP_10085 [Spirochaetaceae bacterium]